MLNKILFLVKIVFSIVLGLIFWQFASYIWLADSSRIDTVINYLPPSADKIKFVCPDKATTRNMAKEDLEYLGDLLKRYYETVYLNPDRIPEKYIQIKVVGTGRKQTTQRLLLQGFEFNYQLRDAAVMYFKASYEVHESAVASASYHQKEYFWILGRWMPRE